MFLRCLHKKKIFIYRWDKFLHYTFYPNYWNRTILLLFSCSILVDKLFALCIFCLLFIVLSIVFKGFKKLNYNLYSKLVNKFLKLVHYLDLTNSKIKNFLNVEHYFQKINRFFNICEHTLNIYYLIWFNALSFLNYWLKIVLFCEVFKIKSNFFKN